MRSLLPIIGLILWFFVVKGCLLDPSCEKCCSEDIGSQIAPATKIKDHTGPLLYRWGNCDPVSKDKFYEIRDSILLGMNDDRALEILGLYCTGEMSTCDEKDLGMARAKNIGNIFKGRIRPDKLRLRSRLSYEDCNDLRSIMFRGVRMRYLVDNEFVKEIDDKTLINFEYATDQKLKNPKIDAYLKDVATRVKKSGERIALTGHTDDTGDAAKNLVLGQKRADAIKDILIAHGVDDSKISTNSRGEEAPIATNDTSAGRQENRRTELQII